MCAMRNSNPCRVSVRSEGDSAPKYWAQGLVLMVMKMTRRSRMDAQAIVKPDISEGWEGTGRMNFGGRKP